jgi:hypothetical protein
MSHPVDTALRDLVMRPATRRSLLGALIAGVLFPAATPAKKRRKRRRRNKPTPNAVGCLDVGVACRGNSGACCSGICLGKKPRRRKKDTSRCAEHNTGGCLLENDSCGLDIPNTPCGVNGFCVRTTGSANVCANFLEGRCAACRRDEDCQEALGPGAACMLCINGSLCPSTGGRLCVPPAA